MINLYKSYPALPGVMLGIVLAGCAGTSSNYRSPVIEQGTVAPAGSVPSPAKPQQPATSGSVPPRSQSTTAQPAAVVALLDRAEQQANSGDLDAAAVTLERAIRIDPRNPVLWHHLATLRLAEGEAVEAEQLAAKSNSLAAGNYSLQVRNWELIADARRHRGDVAGSRSAEQRARALGSR